MIIARTFRAAARHAACPLELSVFSTTTDVRFFLTRALVNWQSNHFWYVFRPKISYVDEQGI